MGESFGTIENSFVTGQVAALAQAGGLVGTVQADMSISNSYSRASVSFDSGNPNYTNGEYYQGGGLVGRAQGTNSINDRISFSWSSGLVETPDDVPEDLPASNYFVGGVVGALLSTATVGFDSVRWDTEASTQSTDSSPNGPEGTTTELMQTFETYDEDGYDIVNGWDEFNFSSPTNFWGICADTDVNDGYPFLLWEYRTDPCVTPSTSGESSGSAKSSTPAAAGPALHLDLQASAGDVVPGSTVLMEGEGLQPGSPYKLELRSSPITVRSGTASTEGRFSHFVTLPSGVAAGSHTLTLTGVGADGSALSLATTFDVSNAGTFTSISPGVGSAVEALAATGPNTSGLTTGVVLSFALLALGLGVLASSRRKALRVS